MKALTFVMVGLVVGLLATTATAGGEKMTATPPQFLALSQAQPFLRAQVLIGMPVRNEEGNLEGVVKDILLTEDKSTAQTLEVVFADVAPGRLVEVPLSACRLTPDRAKLVYNVTREKISDLAAVAPTALPEGAVKRSVSHLIGLAVRDNTNSRVGRVRDVLIASDSGRITEATVGVGGFVGLGEKLASVRWDTITFAADGQYCAIGMPASGLRALAFRERDYWKQLGFSGRQELTYPREGMKKTQSDTWDY